MERKRVLECIFPASAMIVLMMDGRTALTGAGEGIDICIRTVIPSLFPFIFLCVLLDKSLSGCRSSFLGPLSRLIGFPEGHWHLMISSFIGGYPVGAQAVAYSHRQGSIDKETAEKLLAFSNNAGPAFIFGMLGPMFSDPKIPWLLWGIHILSAMMIGIIMSPCTRSSNPPIIKSRGSAETMSHAVKVTGIICGWVILFRILICFLEKWVLKGCSPVIHTVCAGLLELANGCCLLTSIEDIRIRMIICSGLLALGGICVTMQTMSVIHGLRIRYYLLGKVFHSILSLVISASLVFRMWTVLLILSAGIIVWRVKHENFCGNLFPIRV